MMPKFTAAKKLDGFDESVSPHWLMVGLDTEKSVFLNDGSQLTIKMRHSEIAEIISDVATDAPRQRIITVKGKRKGTTFLDVFDGNVRKTTLEICVKTRREVKVSFHYVFDKNDVGTARNPSHLQGIVDLINDKVFLPQANVFVKIGIINDKLKVDRVLGRCIRDPAIFTDVANPKGEAGYVVSFRDRAADINVFFVIDYESGKNVNKAAGVQYEKGIFVDDNINKKSPLATIENVLAHEIAHFLGAGGESHYYYRRNIGSLMYFKARGGLHIPKFHANLINR